MKWRLVIAGVGGQGILTTNRIIGKTAVREGKRIFTSEVHGMAQRGGSVISMSEIGDEACNPLVGMGEADAILGFESVETLRTMEKAGNETHVIMNVHSIIPPNTLIGKERYPDIEEISRIIERKVHSLKKINANEIANNIGTERVVNSVMIGALTQMEGFPLSANSVREAIRDVVPDGYTDVNIEAFDMGAKAI